MSSMVVFAAAGGNPAFVPANTGHATSNRLIVKFKASTAEQVMSAEQRYAEMSRPLANDVIQQLQSAAGAQLSDLRATGTGAHVMTLAGSHGTQTVAQAVAAISKLSNVEYVEEDQIETIKAVPNDTYYTTVPNGNPGLWGMWPVNAVAGTAPGGVAAHLRAFTFQLKERETSGNSRCVTMGLGLTPSFQNASSSSSRACIPGQTIPEPASG